MANQLDKFFSENSVKEPGNNCFGFSYPSLFCFIGVLFEADSTNIEIVGKRFVERDLTPVVKYYLKNGAQCVIGCTTDGFDVTLFGSDPLNKDTLRKYGLEAGKTVRGVREGFSRDIFFDTFEKNSGTFSSHIKGDEPLWNFVRYVEAVNSPRKNYIPAYFPNDSVFAL